jgi:hypothetical protein
MQIPANVLVLELPGFEIVGTGIRVTDKTGNGGAATSWFLGCAR